MHKKLYEYNKCFCVPIHIIFNPERVKNKENRKNNKYSIFTLHKY